MDDETVNWAKKIEIIRWQGVDIPIATAIRHTQPRLRKDGNLRPEGGIEDVTPREILAEPNAEVRRILIDLYGLNDFLLDCGATVIDDDPQFGTFVEFQIEDNTYYAVIVVNGTPVPNWKPGNPREQSMYTADGRRKYALLIPERLDGTAHAAVAWTYGKKKHEYNPTRRT